MACGKVSFGYWHGTDRTEAKANAILPTAWVVAAEALAVSNPWGDDKVCRLLWSIIVESSGNYNEEQKEGKENGSV
jgi:hypothetical protein